MHYARWKRLGEPGGPDYLHMRGGASGGCTVQGCIKTASSNGYCPMHNRRLRVNGSLGGPASLHTTRSGRDPASTRCTTSGGYVLIKVPNHSAANKVGWALEHRVLMSNHLGRPLEQHEYVHHINGVKDDNRLVNLELWSSWQPPGQRVADKVEWAKAILALYD